MRTLLFLSLSLSLVACGDDDGGRPRDSGTGTDSGMVTPPVDGGGEVDSGTTPPTDSGAGIDSGMISTGMCPAGACNVESGAGCEAGEGCYFASVMEGMDPAPVCAPAGTGGPGSSCTSVNDCREGHLCIQTGATTSECRKVCCDRDTSACAIGDICNAVTGFELVGVCETPSGCSVVNQTGCPDGQACVVIAGDGSSGCRPDTGGTVMQGGDCAEERCAAGFLCLGPAEGPNFCGRACDPMAATSGCAEGTVCGRITGFPENLGACVPAT